MRKSERDVGVFQKVGECLYRYSTNGVYYGRIKHEGKEIKRSLETTDRAIANRNLAKFKREQGQIDRSQGKLTLAELCDRWVATIRNLRPKTVKQKSYIISKIKRDWPTGSIIQVAKIKPSDCDLWLVRYHFGASSRNVHVQCLKDLFAFALRDKIIPDSPAAHLKYENREKPIRLTPTFEQFKAIIADVRAQVFNADAQHSADFLEAMGLLGLGQAELGSLRRCDVDLEAGTITTFRRKTATGFQIPVYPQARPLLEKLCKEKSNGDYVFKLRDGKKALAGACRRLNLPPFTQRALRRMFVTHAIERGVDVKVIAEWQGHKDGGKLILSTYSHVNRAHSQRMAQLMTDAEPSNVVTLQKGVA
jgi:integrase